MAIAAAIVLAALLLTRAGRRFLGWSVGIVVTVLGVVFVAAMVGMIR